MSQYAPKGVKSLCVTSSQTVYVRKPDLVSCKTLVRLGGWLICEIYLNTYFQRARLGGRLICEIGLYAVYMVYAVQCPNSTFHHVHYAHPARKLTNLCCPSLDEDFGFRSCSVTLDFNKGIRCNIRHHTLSTHKSPDQTSSGHISNGRSSLVISDGQLIFFRGLCVCIG